MVQITFTQTQGATMRRPDLQLGRYLRRWWLIPRNRVFNIYLHRFDASDHRILHDHPWWSVSLLIKGAYREHYHDGTAEERWAPCLVVRAPRQLHRIELLTVRATTLFITGPRQRTWGFMSPSLGRWVRHDGYDPLRTDPDSVGPR